MRRNRIASPQTRAVLRELAAATPSWQHGYDLAKATGLKSGTLYPMLARLAERDLLETMWEQEQPIGRPRRHLYRLTPLGAGAAAELGPEHSAVQHRTPTASRPLVEVGHAH